MENLHPDIIENILFRLPKEAALHAKRVCTSWRVILRDKTERSGFLFTFSHSEYGSNSTVRKQLFYEDEYDHYDHANINFYHSDQTLSKIEHGRCITKSSPRKIMIGSCNGLVCLGKDNKDAHHGIVPFLICNPLTGESFFLPEYAYCELPRDISSKNHHRGSLSSGFGYCNATNSYKVVTIYYHHKQDKGYVQVYTVGGRKWRYTGCISRYNQKKFDFSSGIYANGALHWWSIWLHQQCEVVAFDLETETFRHIILPCSYHPPLKLLGGNNNLYLVTGNRTPCIDIWVHREYKITCSRETKNHSKRWSPWIKEFSIQSGELYKYITPFAITRNNEVLLWYHHSFGLRLYCYDRNTSTLNDLWDKKTAKGMKCIYIQAVPHIQSVVSLKYFGETNVASLKDLEELMLPVSPNGLGEKTVRS